MDEISLLTAVRPAAPEFPAADRAAARQRLLAAIAAERAVPPGPAVQRPSRRTWTPRRIAVAGALAAHGAAAVLLVALPGPHRPGNTLPSTVPGMLAYLEKLAGGLSGTPAYRVLVGISQESWESRLLIPNHSYALMFRAASAVPGIRVIRHVTDAAGRSGVAVAACMPGAIQKGTMSGLRGCRHLIELVFDPRTYQFIGDNEAGGPSSGLLKIAVVGKAGQLLNRAAAAAFFRNENRRKPVP